jgi:predicted metal-dependent hydrolase
MIIDRLIRTRRKTIALIVEDDGSLTVRAPLRVSNKRILELVEQKSEWIQSKRELVRALPPVLHRKAYATGETFWYLGDTYPLEIVPETAQPLHLDGKFYLAQAALPDAGAAFTHWYKQQAMQVIGERARWHADRHGFSYRRIKITSAQGRWGSCSHQGSVCFTWRLVMTPLEEIDYVVVHELVHLVEKNHSKAFWGKVEAILPDYKARRKWLKENNQLLSAYF